MIKLTPAEWYRRQRENDEAQARRDRAWKAAARVAWNDRRA